jgi:hypothetical protein
MDRARAARARGFDNLPSLSDIGTVTAVAFDEYCRFDTSACASKCDKASLALSHWRKQKYQNGNIHRKLTVSTSVISCRS